MKHNIRMIGLDLDGTLLTSQKTMTSYTKSVLEEALLQGIHVLVSTGRPISAIPREILEIPGMKYAVTANGARILELSKDGEDTVLREHTVSVDIAKKALEIFKEYDTIHEIFIEGTGYSSQNVKKAEEYFENPSMAEYLLKTRIPVENVIETLKEKNKSVEKVQGIFKNVKEQEEALPRLLEIKGITVTSALGNNLELNQEGVDKGKALLELGELLGISKDEIMACGDGMNDYEMLKTVGFAVAMENADSRLKEIADYITVTNDEDGVAKAIKKFALRTQ